VKFKVGLADARNPRLRNALRVDVLVVTDVRANALRVPKGPFAQGGQTEAVFVVQGDRAVRRRVRLGLTGYEYYEVLDGLSPGNVVIVSDMKDYTHLDRIDLK